MENHLPVGYKLQFHNQPGEYTILKVIGKGASTIAYLASYENGAGLCFERILKEYCPCKIPVNRGTNGSLICDEKYHIEFERGKECFIAGGTRQNEIRSLTRLQNETPPLQEVFAKNNTVYLEVTPYAGKTYDRLTDLTLLQKMSVCLAVAKLVRQYHTEGYLCLDIKPENIFVLTNSSGEIVTDLIEFVDFDSVRKKTEISFGNSLSFTATWAAPEQKCPHGAQRICEATDIYAIGELVFWSIFGRHSLPEEHRGFSLYPFCDAETESSSILAHRSVNIILISLFRKTLRSSVFNRFSSVKDVVILLEQLITEVGKERYIKSSTIPATAQLFGRKHDLQSLTEWFEDKNSSCAFVTGMGGIGKSTLVRTFLAQQDENIDNLLYLTFSGSIPKTLIDDTAACISAVEKDEKESLQEYYTRKLRVFSELVADTNSVLVIDNYSGDINQDLADVIAVGWKVILISRKSPVAAIYTKIPVGALTEREDLYRLFEHNLGSKLLPTDYGHIDNIISKINGHTLVLELIAKQISSSYLSISEASDLVDTHGFAAMASERVIYSKDADAYPETLRNIITALFEADDLSAQMRSLLKVMSLIDSNGIDIRLLHDVLCIDSKDDANTLIRDGWMNLSDKVVSLHPVIQETVHCWDWSADAKAHAIKLMEFLFRELKAEEHREDYPPKLLWLMELSQDSFEKHPRLKKWFDRFTENQGYIGETVRQRYERCKDWSPADHKKIALYVQMSEGVLDNCKREPVLLEENIYCDLLYRAVINMPRYREDFIIVRAEELLSNPRCQNGFTIMKLYDCILSIYQEQKDFDAAEKKLREAKKAAKKFSHNYVWAQYYNLLSAFYDHALRGTYDAVEADEEPLFKKMVDAIDKTIHYARKSHRPGGKHLLAENLLAKASLLMRSEPKRKKEIDKLLAEAEKIVFAETQPYAQVRCIYYMVKAWYATLIVPSFAAALVSLSKAAEISEQITPTDLDEIDSMIIPCADMMCIWERYSYSAESLMDGIKVCEQKETAVPYIRKKMELYRRLLDVYNEWGKQELCRRIIEKIDDGNHKYKSVGVCIDVPEELRSLYSSDEIEIEGDVP